MIDTNELESLSIEELRTGIVSQRKEIDRLRAQLASRAGVPEGWKLVPVEITEAMKSAGMGVLMNQTDIYADEYGNVTVETITPRRIYTAMLAAAPSPEGQAESNYVHTVPDECETLHWRGQILSMNELAALAQQQSGGAFTDSEILSIAYDVNAMPETMTDAALIRFARAIIATALAAQPQQEVGR